MAFLRTTGIPDERWLHNRRVEYKKVERAAPEPRPMPVRTLWDFATARSKYLEEVERTKRPETHHDYTYMLNIAELQPLEKKIAADITRVELASIVGNIHRSGRERHAEHLASVLRPMWTFLAEDTQIRKSGVQPGAMTALRAPVRTLDEDDGDEEDAYVPPLAELGRILAIARAGVLEEQIGLAVELLVFTAQRRLTIVSAKVAHFEELPDGSGIWSIPPARRKSGTSRRGKTHDHVVPLPPIAWRPVKRAIELAKAQESVWLFPGFRPKRKGDPVSHMNQSVLTRALLLMPGVQASPHDVRRSFGTIGESVLGLMRSDTKAILDHNEGEKSGDVTRAHYALHDGRHFKWPIMQRWCDAVEPKVEQAIAADRKLLDSEWLKTQVDAARYGED